MMDCKRSLPSIADIAKLAHVSKSTVSLALRNDTRVVEIKRQRIKKIAREIGYHSNPRISRLMEEMHRVKAHKYEGILAFVSAYAATPDYQFKIRQTREALLGADRRARQHGYSPDHFWLHDSALTPRRLMRIFRARNIQGTMLYNIDDEKYLRRFRDIWLNFPTIVLGSRPKNPPLHFVTADLYLNSYHLCVQLQKLGYSRIGIILHGWLDDITEHRFVGGYSAGLQKDGEILPIHYIEHEVGTPYLQEHKEGVYKWIIQNKPDACICINDYVAAWIKEWNINHSCKIGITFLDRSQEHKGQIAGITQQHRRLGMTAVDMLVGQILRREKGIPYNQRGTLLEGKWESGLSVERQK